MAKKSLTATPSSNNDIDDLALLLESNFQYQSNRTPSCKIEYIRKLNLSVGLSLTAIMVRGTCISIFQYNLNQLVDRFISLASLQCNSIELVALDTAKIMYEASRFIPKVDELPEFGNVLRKTFHATIRSGLLDTSKNKELSTRLLKTMLKEPSYH